MAWRQWQAAIQETRRDFAPVYRRIELRRRSRNEWDGWADWDGARQTRMRSFWLSSFPLGADLLSRLRREKALESRSHLPARCREAGAPSQSLGCRS